MTWILYVYIGAVVNGLQIYIPTVVEGPVEFGSAEQCVMHAARYASAETKVLCRSEQRQIEVKS